MLVITCMGSKYVKESCRCAGRVEISLTCGTKTLERIKRRILLQNKAPKSWRGEGEDYIG